MSLGGIPLELALLGYAQGYFPMAESKDDIESLWVRPKMRAVIPLDDRFHLPKKLSQKIRNSMATIKADTAFEQVLSTCRETTKNRTDSWINDEVYALYLELFEAGYAHSIEYWEDDELKGGLYGLHIGGVFFGESMFSRATDASKICLAHLVATLKEQGFKILDAQFMSDHLKQFGAYEIANEDFMPLLEEALQHECKFIFDQDLARG